MAEIRPSGEAGEDHGDAVQQPALQLNSPIQMRGFAADGPSLPFVVKDSRAQEEERDRSHSRASMPVSIRSEPDLDTIMPLSGRQYQRIGSEEKSDSDDGSEGNPQTSSFTNVEHPMIGSSIFGDDLTAKALEACKKTVLNPYLAFLKVIGWRRFNPKRYDLRTPTWLQVLNVVWPTIVCLLLVISCVTQITTCFRRDTVLNTPHFNSTSNTTIYSIRCRKHVLTTYILPDILLIFSFAYGLYIFRWVQIEQLSTLTEAVFLGHITHHGKYTHKRLTRTLQLLIFLGIFWIVFSFGTSIGRAYSLHLLDKNSDINLIPSTPKTDYVIRWVFVTITIVGFVLLDIAYTAVVVNYCFQCQLIIYLLRSISERTKCKEWEIDRAIKEMHNCREFLSQLNSHLSRAISVMLFIFLTSSINSIYGIHQVNPAEPHMRVVSLLGVLASIQWFSILALPLIQAARLTRSCSSLRKTVTEIRSRPYSYKDTPQLDLDSIVIYTSRLSMSAKLISIPVTPALVAGLFFFTGLGLFLVFQYGTYSWAEWL